MSEPVASEAAVDVGVVVALGIEAGPLRDRLVDATDFHPDGLRISVGRLGRVRAAVVAGGVGAEAARRATRLVIEGHRPARVVAAGLCGGLDPSLARGAIVVANSVLAWNDAIGSPSPAPRSLGRPGAPLLAKLPRPARVGLVVSSGQVVATTAGKRALHEATGAVAVDMESWWIAEESARAGIEPWVIRAVSDTSDEAVPGDVAELGGATSTSRVAGAAIRLLWKRPSSLFDMAELRERAHVAADALAEAISTLLRTD
jgi:adenosylhomocysteine nucleosidase